VINLIFALALMAEPAYPAGIEVHRSDCASGGDDWFFFADGTVISKCSGCESWPSVALGNWRRNGSEVRVELKKAWFGRGRGRIVNVGSVNAWEDYVAVMRAADRDVTIRTETFKAEDFTRTNDDSCEFARKHDRSPDPHAFLRQFEGEHPETFQRVLQPAEFSKMTPEQMRAMRNEVFARYGYRFKDPALAAQFAKFKGYQPRLSNVDDFLSDVERENVKRLSAAEQRTKGKGTDR